MLEPVQTKVQGSQICLNRTKPDCDITSQIQLPWPLNVEQTVPFLENARILVTVPVGNPWLGVHPEALGYNRVKMAMAKDILGVSTIHTVP